MKPISELKAQIKYLFCDIDDTLTDEGKLGSEAYSALWKLSEAGIQVVPVTGRPAGWCELIARLWPVAGVVGENGGLYYRYSNKKMIRYFAQDEKTRASNRKKLDGEISDRILSEVPGCALASDQFCRIFDLAIDFCEDVKPLAPDQVDKIVSIFKSHGAVAKISSIHVNGWFGDFDKLTTTMVFLKNEMGLDFLKNQKTLGFVGDSPNDEPMFAAFENSFGVANIKNFSSKIKNLPKFVTPSNGGKGFSELAKVLLGK